MLRASRWVGVVVLSGCGLFDASKDPCLENPHRCVDSGLAPAEEGKLGSACSSDDQCAGTLRLSCEAGSCNFASDLLAGDPCKVTLECGPSLFCSVEDLSFQCKPAGTGT